MRLPAALLALLLAAACSGSADTAAPRPTSPLTRGPAASGPPSSPGTALPSASASAGSDGVALQQVPKGYRGGFTSPTSNISCDLDESFVVCSVRDHPWKQMPVEEGCRPGQWETVVTLSTTSTAALRGQCYRPDGGPVLAYGTGFALGKLRCAMQRSGLECLLTGTDQGFFVSRSDYRLTAKGSRLGSARPGAASGAVQVVPAGFYGGFVTPSGNITCNIGDSAVTCYAQQPPWERPEYPDCGEEGYGDPTSTIGVDEDGPGQVVGECWSDFPMVGGEALAYGHSLRVGRMQCDSATTGITCRNRSSGHGFSASRSSYRVF